MYIFGFIFLVSPADQYNRAIREQMQQMGQMGLGGRMMGGAQQPGGMGGMGGMGGGMRPMLPRPRNK